jgi:hypothetical protein
MTERLFSLVFNNKLYSKDMLYVGPLKKLKKAMKKNIINTEYLEQFTHTY